MNTAMQLEHVCKMAEADLKLDKLAAVDETPQQAAEAAWQAVETAKRAFDEHIKSQVPIFGTVDRAKVTLAKAAREVAPTYHKVADQLMKAHDEWARIAVTYPERIAKRADERIAKLKTAIDGLAETFALEKNLTPTEAHERLMTISPAYERVYEAYVGELDVKLADITAAEQGISAAIYGLAFKQQATAKAAPVSKYLPAEQKLMNHAAVIAKRRGVTVEQALADGVSTGIYADDQMRALYDTAQDERDEAVL